MAELEKPVHLTKHTVEKVTDRGVSLRDIQEAIRLGRREAAQRGLPQYRLNLEYDGIWGGKYYRMRQVLPVVAEEAERYVEVTVYAFYFQEGRNK
jgi:hypothetical protein